jgi:hypothetical protein
MEPIGITADDITWAQGELPRKTLVWARNHLHAQFLSIDWLAWALSREWVSLVIYLHGLTNRTNWVTADGIRSPGHI